MKILVTGGCGFIGSHIIDLLVQQGFETAAADDLSAGSPHYLAAHKGKVVFYHCSILCEEFERAMSHFRPDVVIHLAAQVSVSHSVHDPIHDANVNIMGSLKLIELAKKYQVKKIVFSSSAAVYGHPQFLPVTTVHPLNPMSPYGISKMVFENYLFAAKTLYNIDYHVLRFGNVYGPRQNSHGEGGVISIFINTLLQDKSPTIYGDGTYTRDFVYVADVAMANVLAALSPESGTANICSSVGTSISELLGKLQRLMKKQIQPLYEKPRNGDIPHSVLCNKEAKVALNWEPTVSLDEGLLQTIAFYQTRT
ncbi:NAD-dependent epimerase/dehydratase family protein [Fictibacillus iocasae]|uniref:NAD-dependent epimerase/dehydratase family protein n=1 Tax=Fictibacillus iocasae TaxID=2715437 RepID=A0ABW2NM39_9BACL